MSNTEGELRVPSRGTKHICVPVTSEAAYQECMEDVAKYRQHLQMTYALFLRHWGVPFDTPAHLFGRDAVCGYRAWLSFGRANLVGTSQARDHEAPGLGRG